MGVEPDIMTVAKPLAGGLPIGAVLCTDDVASAMAPGDHGSTFAGGPLVCHAANAVYDRVTSPGFIEAVKERGEQLRAGLREKLAENEHVVEVRGSGLPSPARAAGRASATGRRGRAAATRGSVWCRPRRRLCAKASRSLSTSPGGDGGGGGARAWRSSPRR